MNLPSPKLNRGLFWHPGSATISLSWRKLGTQKGNWCSPSGRYIRSPGLDQAHTRSHTDHTRREVRGARRSATMKITRIHKRLPVISIFLAPPKDGFCLFYETSFALPRTEEGLSPSSMDDVVQSSLFQQSWASDGIASVSHPWVPIVTFRRENPKRADESKGDLV